MKRHTITASFIAVCITIMFIVTGCDSKALNVSDISSDPAAFKGSITITGIMAGAFPENPGIFGIMDVKELQCKTQNCNKLIVPVSYRGNIPVPGDEVRIIGSFINQGNGYLFVAEKVTVVRNHKIGA